MSESSAVSIATQAEAATVAAALADPGFRALVLAEPPDLFAPGRWRTVRDALDAVAGRGEPVDTVTVAAEAARRGLPEAGALLGALPAPSTQYLPLLRRARLDRVGRTVAQALLAGRGDPEHRLAVAAGTLWQALAAGPETLVPAGAAARQGRARAQAGPAAWLRTGVPALDAACRTLGPGRMLTVGGRPSQGKSALLSQMALATAATGRGVLLCSLEMDAPTVGLRLVAQAADVDHAALVDGRLDPDAQARADAACARLDVWPLQVADPRRLTPETLRLLVLRIRQQQPCDVVLVDYLQLLQAPDDRRFAREYDRVTYVSNALRELAAATRTLIVAAAQLRRPDRQAAGGRPGPEELRSSGAIEQDSDAVLLIHHDPARPGLAELGLVKNRHGATGWTPVRWVGSRLRFVGPVAERSDDGDGRADDATAGGPDGAGMD